MKPGRILLSQTQIRTRVRELGRALTRRYRGKNVLVLGVMNGALFFLADLLRSLELDDAQIACVRLASYAGTKSTGLLRGLDDLGSECGGRHVLIVDDILDTGRTLSALAARLRKLGAVEVKICVLLAKHRRRDVPVRAGWTGFTIADEFVVGYGLDYNGRYRGLKQIRVLSKEPT
jgi:hypoxanthine phosphoribosyltransferase